MNKATDRKLAGTILSLALAAAVAAASAGCAGRTDTPASSEADTTAGADLSAGADTSSGEAVTEAAAGTGAAADGTDSPVNDFLSGSAADGAAGAQTAGTQDSAAQTAEGAEGSEAGTADTAGGLSGEGSVGSGQAETASPAEGSGSGTESTGGPVFSLHKEELHEALEECTGWGQSAGSSLRSATAATELLCWANTAGTGSADAKTLEEAIKTEVASFSDEQVENMKSNWSSVSFNVSMILDDFDEVKGLLEDAGCLETARGAAADENVLANWKAAEKALDAAMK